MAEKGSAGDAVPRVVPGYCAALPARREGRGAATLARHRLVAGKWHPGSGGDFFQG